MVDKFMKAAIDEAYKGLSEKGIPIGAVLVKDGKILARGHNRRVQQSDPVMHAEIDCMRKAGGARAMRGALLYTTLMPCYMCAGAVLQFGIKKVVVGEAESLPGAEEILQQYDVDVVNLDLDKCKRMLGDFIRANPELWGKE